MTVPRRGLVLVDLQQEYEFGPLAIRYPPQAEAVAQVLAAVDVAEEAGLPIAIVQHEDPVDSPVFAHGSPGQALQAPIAARLRPEWGRITKRFASVFDGTDFAAWCARHRLDTLTLVGHMTNNCIIATAASAEAHGLAAEVLSDATGAIGLSNEAGSVPADHLHAVLMTLLHSNFAAVATTARWADAVRSGEALPASNLIASAIGAES